MEGQQAGDITLIIGPVSSGKTSRLFLELEREEIAISLRGGRKDCSRVWELVILIKPVIDDRSGSAEITSTHPSPLGSSGASRQRSGIPAERLSDVIGREDVRRAEVIGIDEGQFFPDLLRGVLALSLHARVYVSALSSTWRGVPFLEDGKTSNPLALVPHSSPVIALHGVCVGCGDRARPAIYSMLRSSETGGVLEGDVKIGGAELYSPMCRWCYRKTGLLG